MIDGFAYETDPLSAEEMKLLPLFVKGFANKIGKGNAITNSQIRLAFLKKEVRVPDTRVRKIVNHIRTQGLVKNLCASGEGYFIAANAAELEEYIKALRQRIGAQMAVLKALDPHKLGY